MIEIFSPLSILAYAVSLLCLVSVIFMASGVQGGEQKIVIFLVFAIFLLFCSWDTDCFFFLLIVKVLFKYLSMKSTGKWRDHLPIAHLGKYVIC